MGQIDKKLKSKRGSNNSRYADITQLGECFPYKEEVGSSNLSIGTKSIMNLYMDAYIYCRSYG